MTFGLINRVAAHNSWRHVAVTWSGDVWQFYLDGILAGHGDCAKPGGAPSRDDSKLNLRPSGFNGDITLGSQDIVLDEIRISSRPRYGWPSQPEAALAAAPAVVAAVKTSPPRTAAAANLWQPTFRQGDLSFDATTNEIVPRTGSMAGQARFGDNTGVSLPDPQDMLAWPVMPAAIRRETLDLQPYLNRALADETADDGLGGWTDQGARFDMRNLPTGVLSSEGVPFAIPAGKLGCLVLWNQRATNLPKSVAFHVNRRLAGAWFLHSVAWCSAPNMENYQFLMEYEDGSSERVRVITGQHVWDWGAALPHAFRDSANRAWTGFTTTCEGFPQVSVYGLEWVNPDPERVVKTIRFETLNPAVVPILVGITLAVPTAAPAAVAPPTPAPQVEAMTADEQERCRVLREAGKTDELVKKLRGLLEKTPAKVDAHKLLGFVLWNSRKDYDGAETQYLDALKVTGENSDTLNQLGRLNEERKAYAKARGYYQRSLKAEWNQPPTMEALQRVEAAIGR